jgi:multidrug transporter EmrE-like cation transporter
MITAACFLVGAIMYSVLAYASYDETIKASNYYYLLGLAVAIVANFSWLTVAKYTTENDKIMILGSIWDSIILFTFLAIPYFYFNVRLATKDYIGVGLIVIGILVVKFIK